MSGSAFRTHLFLGTIAVLDLCACGTSHSAPADPTASASTGGSSTSDGVGGTANDTTGGTSAGGSGDETAGAAAVTPVFTLRVGVDGDGQVVSDPPGIQCGTSCRATFPVGTRVELKVKEEGGVLTGWGVGPCSGTSACTLTLTEDTLVSATFRPIAVGGTAHGIAVTPDGQYALVTIAELAGALKRVALDDYSVGAGIAVGTYPTAVAVTPDGSRALVTNTHDVSVVTLATQAVTTVASPCASDALYDIAITPDGSKAVTTMLDGSCVNNSVALIALDTVTVAHQYDFPALGTQGIALTSDGSSAIVSRGILGTQVSRVSLSDGSITDIPDTNSSFGIAVTSGGEALVASGDGDTIKRVSLASNTVTGSIDYASNQDPHDIAVSPDGSLAVAVGSFDVGVLSLSRGKLAKTFSGGGRSVAITPDGKRALVTLGSAVRVFSLEL